MTVFQNNAHAKRWYEAMCLAGAIKSDGGIKSDFGASLYLITAMRDVYDRAKQFIHDSWIDFAPMLNELGLSSGERTIVALAGNLYNGGFFYDYSPIDIIGNCDEDLVILAGIAIVVRKHTLTIDEIYPQAAQNGAGDA